MNEGRKHEPKQLYNDNGDVRNRAKALVINNYGPRAPKGASTTKRAAMWSAGAMSINVTRADGSVIQLPINPPSFDVSTGMNHQTVTVGSLGEVLLTGKKKIKEVSFSSLFPAQAYSFCRWTPQPPAAYISAFEDIEAKAEIVTLAITVYGLVMRCVIDKFNHGNQDGSGDITYSITFKEYVNTAATRAQLGTKKVEYKVKKKKEKWYSIARKMTGRASDAKAISKKNGYKGKINKSPKKGKKLKYNVSY